MHIAVASGKGGTGKTTVSVNLFHFYNKFTNAEVSLLDCDVEEPNSLLFFKKHELMRERIVFQQIPHIDTTICTFCKDCAEWCNFNAISIVASQKFASVNVELCHSCGACFAACRQNAITEMPSSIGSISSYCTGRGQMLIEGRLSIGSSMPKILIKELKRESASHKSLVILDAPPGNGCPLVQTLTDTDFVILVTEPTPFGLHDLKIAVEVVNLLNIPFGVVINKSMPGFDILKKFLNVEQISILGEIPFDNTYANGYLTGSLLSNISSETEKIYESIIDNILMLS